MTKDEAPVVTIVVGILTASVSIAGILHPDVLESLQRHPIPGAWPASWRLLTSLFVHDGGFALAFNLVGFAIVGATVERRMGAARWIALYVAGGIVGELAGLAWQPVGAGNSVASFGLVGGLLASLVVERTPATLATLYAAEWVLVYTGLELGLQRVLDGLEVLMPGSRARSARRR